MFMLNLNERTYVSKSLQIPAYTLQVSHKCQFSSSIKVPVLENKDWSPTHCVAFILGI